MKKLFSILLLTIVTSTSAARQNHSNSFGRSTDEVKPISVSELTWRLHLKGEILVLSADGERLISAANETREWSFNGQNETPIVANWGYTQAGLPEIAIHHEWKLENDGTLNVLIQQFDSMQQGKEDEVKYGKLIKENRFILKDLAPVNVTIPHGDKKVIVRITPGIWPDDPAMEVKSLPLSLKRAVLYDGKGKVWADQVNVSASFVGLSTHLGTVYLSFTPFKGSKLIGEAKGSRIKIKDRGTKVVLQSETPLVPHQSKVNVYGLIDPNKRTSRLRSVLTIGSDKEDEFVKRF